MPYDDDNFDLMTLILMGEYRISETQARTLLAEKQALKRQGQVVPTCELALNFRFISPLQAEAAARLYARLVYPPGRQRPLGWLVLQAGLVTPSQLVVALERQRVDGTRLGRILMAMSLITQAQLEALLASHMQTSAA